MIIDKLTRKSDDLLVSLLHSPKNYVIIKEIISKKRVK